ncbi:hypothetical protein RYX36_003406 [Vicia faba]
MKCFKEVHQVLKEISQRKELYNEEIVPTLIHSLLTNFTLDLTGADILSDTFKSVD